MADFDIATWVRLDGRPAIVAGGTLRCAGLAAVLSLAWSPVFAEAGKVAVLKGLDKITARVTTFEVPVGGSAEFGTLRITLDACNKRPPEETPETTAFLEIDEVRPGDGAPTRLFTGWMFASSPALSALEHPVYDVWVIDCKMAEGDKSTPAQEKSAR